MERKLYTKEDFAWTQWDAKAIKALAPKITARKKERYAAIKAIPDNARNFENTIYAIEASNYDIAPKIHQIGLLLEVSPEEDIRNAAQEALEIIERELIEIEYDEAIYRALKAFEAKNLTLEGEDVKLFHDMMRDYRRMGFELPASSREKFKENVKSLAKSANDFNVNINRSEGAILVTHGELDGLPESFIARLVRNDEGLYRVSIQYPEYIPFMENAKNEARRKELKLLYLQKGGEENEKLLSQILALRQENARMLGYKNHAEYKTETQMAKNPEAALAFLYGLAEKMKGGIEQDLNMMRDFKRRMSGNSAAELEYHDWRYCMEQLRKERFNVDNETVREYFPFEAVKKGMFEIYAKLFSVTFKQLSGIPVWHEDVETFGVREPQGGLIGYFMLDLYPRKGKYGHAAVMAVVEGRSESYASANYIAPLACMMANFAKPTKEHPSLLSHHEVEVFFHEFGHVMHDVLTKARYASQSGASVVRDFVEAPSQMLEHWVWNKKMLLILSGHYLDASKKLPDELLDNMLRGSLNMISFFSMRQVVLGLFDFAIHVNGVKNSEAVFSDLFNRYLGFTLPEGSRYAAGFGHLMGYDAGYYGYMWSKVYASDMFARFKKEGLLNAQTGMEYRQWILEKGSSIEEIDLVRGFLGREPNNEAFLKEIGL